MSCATGRRPLRNRRPVLLVEDDPDMREVLADVLGEEDFTVTVAADGIEALAALGQLPRPCILVLDWLMPRLDGAGLLGQLEQAGALDGITVLVTTHYRGRIEDPRVTRVLKKPYDIEVLLGLLDAHCHLGDPPRTRTPTGAPGLESL